MKIQFIWFIYLSLLKKIFYKIFFFSFYNQSIIRHLNLRNIKNNVI